MKIKEDLNKQLLPCPSCGGSGKVKAINKGRWKAVHCTKCEHKTKGHLTYYAAIDDWNGQALIDQGRIENE